MKKTAIIVGASGEIGLATAKKFAEKGYDLALTFNTNNVDFAKELPKSTNFKAFQLDVKNGNKIKDVFDEITANFAFLDTLVFCVGVAQKRALIVDTEDSEIDNLFAVNVAAAAKCTREFVRKTINKHDSNVVLVGSFEEKIGCSCESVYAATKTALSGFAKSLSSELGSLGVRVNVVAPGFIDTKMNANLSSEERDEIADMTPLGRLGTVEDVANAIAFLASDEASFITGQTLCVDGGLILE